MKRTTSSSSSRAVASFFGTVVLAVLASMALLTPDVAGPAVDSLTALPRGLDQIVPTDWLE